MQGHPVIVIGGSAGGLQSLLSLVAGLPHDAAVFVLIHFPAGKVSYLPEILQRESSMPVRHVLDGETIVPGTIYVAPPDHCHLTLEGGRARLIPGAKQHRFRPAIDPLFRSAAAYGARTAGVLLSGHNRDGVAGLKSIQDAGGLVIVQDPEEARVRTLPDAALAQMAVDHCSSAKEIAQHLCAWAACSAAGRSARA